MSAKLASSLNVEDIDYTDPSNKDKFFSGDEMEKAKPYQQRESAPIGEPGAACKPNLFFGFFHDGTRNNFGNEIRKKNHAQSNVARLYSCYPGRSVPNVIPDEPFWQHEPQHFNNYFRVYTPGVGSAFDNVEDTGKGRDAKWGGAAAYKGEPRIVWTLLQAINNLHRFFKNDAPLIQSDRAKSLYPQIRLDKLTLAEMGEPSPSTYLEKSARKAFETILKELHGAIQYHMTGPGECKPQNTDPGQVQQIYVSVFGFSRGAAAARSFANWLVALCKLDAQLLGKTGATLGGFRVNFDFLGLFDTVASVGLANTLNTANGHWGWADAEVSLRVPREFVECLHLVSGHEVRRSFPLDSISVDSALGNRRTEVVYPGVHSDVGGGYRPKEHGKGKDATGTDMLSRLPLAHMYRVARLAGVPLKLELVKQQWVKDDFRIAPHTITAFNQYLSHATSTSGALTDIMREQCKFHILWRQKRHELGSAPLQGNESKGIKGIDSYLAAKTEEQNDLRSANEEFTKEIAEYERWREHYLDPDDAASNVRNWDSGKRQTEDTAPRAPGFKNQRYEEWKEITCFWRKEELPEGMETFFDDYVHDSRASFKLTGPDSDEVEGELQNWVRLMNEYDENAHYEHRQDPLTPDQRRWANEYARTGKVPKMTSGGREPAISGAGYLRYRKIYAGSDSLLISYENHFAPGTHVASTSPITHGMAA